MQSPSSQASIALYRAWEAENMLDSDEPSPAGPAAVDRLLFGLFRLWQAQVNAAINEELPDGHPAP